MFSETQKFQKLSGSMVGLDIELFFDDRHKHIDRDGDPDLALHSILGGTEKRFDSEMLFDPFKKELHLPSIALEIGDCLRRNGKVVGEKVERLVGLAVVVCDSSSRLRRGVLCGGSGQHDRLIASQPMGVVDGMRVAACVPGMALGPVLTENMRFSNLCHLCCPKACDVHRY